MRRSIVSRVCMTALLLAIGILTVAQLRAQRRLRVGAYDRDEQAVLLSELVDANRRLRAEIDEWSLEDLPLILSELDRADVVESSQPDAAGAIRTGIIELYGDKPWAAEAVARARQGLATSETSPE